MSLLVANSVMWVNVHVAIPATVASSRTAESASPQFKMLVRSFSSVDNTTTFA